MAHPTVAILEYHIAVYRRSWRETVFSSFAVPLLLFVGIGTAVGGFVDADGRLGMPYVHYIAPGMLAFAGMQVAMMESGYLVQSYMAWDRIYHGMAAAPPRVIDIVAGQLAYVALRVLLAAFGFLIVMVPLGATATATAVLAPLAAMLVGMAVATPMFAYAASVTGPYLMAVMRFCMLPMVFFSGVFFPIDQMPWPATLLAYPLPLWHGVELCRAATGGSVSAWHPAAHISVLIAWFAVGLYVAHRQFARGLSR